MWKLNVGPFIKCEHASFVCCDGMVIANGSNFSKRIRNFLIGKITVLLHSFELSVSGWGNRWVMTTFFLVAGVHEGRLVQAWIYWSHLWLVTNLMQRVPTWASESAVTKVGLIGRFVKGGLFLPLKSSSKACSHSLIHRPAKCSTKHRLLPLSILVFKKEHHRLNLNASGNSVLLPMNRSSTLVWAILYSRIQLQHHRFRRQGRS